MSRLSAAALVFGLTLCVPACEVDVLAGNVHEDFEATVQLDPDGEFSVKNVNGSIQVETWDRDEVRIEARKSASSQQALERIEIEVRGEGDRVEVKTRYPNMSWFFGGKRSVDYDIRVPKAARVRTETVNGRVEVRDVAGSVRAKSVNGAVHVTGSQGEVDASTVNGAIEVRYGGTPNAGSHEFSAVNGRIEVYLPSSVSGEFSAQAVNGSIKTDLPLEVRAGKYWGPKKMEGRIGEGGAKFKLSIVNGSIKLYRADSTI